MVPPQGDHSFDKDENDFDVEAIRQRLESLAGGVDEGQLDSSDTSAQRFPVSKPPLTM
jgi:hypothetical protein